MTRKAVTQHPRRNCYFCGSEGPIETHHIVPQRLGGSDSESNLVDLCPTCHERLERLYDDDTWYSVAPQSVTQDDEEEEEHEEYKVEVFETSDGELVTVKDVVASIHNEYEEGAPLDDVLSKAKSELGISEQQVHSQLEHLKVKGEVYEPAIDRLRAT